MSLFETISAMSEQHANSGQYVFTDPYIASSTNGDCHNMIVNSSEEPAPTVSLHNLLDHSAQDLRTLSVAVRDQIKSIEDIKLSVASTYTSLCAWKALIDSAITEKHQRDSEAWADKTAKEILGNDNCGPEYNV